MKTIRYIFLTLAAATFVASCSEELNPNEINKANPGDEVQFSLSLPGKTKTVYGDETANEDGTNPRFPIYWVNGDKVKVASPQCQSGRNNAEYSVSVESETQPYATGLTKTGDYGVQWGSEETADFYSIYPSTAGTTLNVDDPDNVTATLHVDATQFANTTNYEKSIYAQPAEMGNVVMYAKTTVNRNDEKTNGVVELHYTPFSTVLEFELTAPGSSDQSHQSEITIQSITLESPTGTVIAGDFIIKFPTETNASPSVSADASGSNVITLHFLDNNQYTTKLTTSVRTLKAKMCVMPISGVENLSGWKVEVATSAGTFSKTLTDQTGELKPGLVHKIKLPQLNYAASEWVFEPGNWIPSLPDYRNIYLSELSLPGAWYAGSTEGVNNGTGYQSTSSITDLWNAGIRAFAVETRTRSGSSAQTNPDAIVLSGSQDNSPSNYDTGSNSLGTGSSSSAKVSYGGKNISTIINDIAKTINKNEYGVLILSYADGGNSGHRAVDYGAWLQLLYDTYNSLDADVQAKIYKDPITANTTVNDVLGSLILKINVDANIAMNGTVSWTEGFLWWEEKHTASYKYENNLPAMFSYSPFLFQINNADYSEPYYSNLYWKNWGDDANPYRSYDLVSNLQGASGNAERFVWVFSSANRTHANGTGNYDIPTYAQRQSALGAMMKYSKQIYDASTHNVWFYFNCGGTEARSQTSSGPSPTAFASTMNPWLLNQITAKTDPSPLGIVMFNQCTDSKYKGPEIIKAIIEMNSRFYLKHAGTSGGNTGGSTGGSEDNTAQNDSSFDNGGEMF